MTPSIQSADRVEITVLVDNYTDLLLTGQTDPVKRPIIPYGQVLLAEHGLSFLIRVTRNDVTHHILMDAGASDIALFYNAERLHQDLSDVEEVFISHGHFDHIGSLIPFLRSSSHRMPVNLHPGAFVKRRKKIPDGSYIDLPGLNQDEIRHAGAVLSLSKDPSLICNRLALLTGEIERTTSYEQGSPVLESEIRGEWIKDPFHDDQSLIIHLKEKGLVVISGCAHSGIINSVRYAQKITGIEKVYAVIGGFHLSGPYFESVIEETVREMQEINPEFIIPLHCTGWAAINQFMEMMPEKVILNTVGTIYIFKSED